MATVDATKATTAFSESSKKLFQITKASVAGSGARLGQLTIPKRNDMNTPNFIGITSRGVIPHLSQDTMASKTNVQSIYVGLEDFIEKASSKQIPPLLSQKNLSTKDPLRDFIGASEHQLVILGARRTPAVTSPWANTQTGISIFTSVGFGKLEAADYADAALQLKADIVVALGDIPFGERAGSRRMDKMSGRTERFVKEILPDEDSNNSQMRVFAPVLPIAYESQSLYIDRLANDWLPHISGLAIYDTDSIPNLPDALFSLPRLSFSAPPNPHSILRDILLGVDIFALPFLNAVTDAGIALGFQFPATTTTESRELGIDMWSTCHASSLEPLVSGCDCYACQQHHRAYVQHLLSAKEMLAWVLLQIHNLRVMDAFFAGVRESIANGTFEEDVVCFETAYAPELPEKTGQGPRVRGYQYKSDGPGETKRNPLAFKMFDDGKVQNAEAPLPDLAVEAEGLMEKAFVEPQ